ncbi:MAG: putative porin [Bacteroidales bacterium]|nr:putative porin [Bacteroidales bacterium]
MKNLWSEILVPAVIAGLTVIGTVGVETSRTVRPEARVRLLREVRLDTLTRDTLPPDSAKTAVPKKETVVKDLSDDDFDFFGVEEEAVDTVPRVFARDTMKVPDSLRLKDPFLYQYYVAVKDSFTHRLVVDSLKAAGDSLDWPRIDSLYRLDSAFVAAEKFRAWYNGLSKSERKRYDNEQKIAKILHRQDSIQQIKDSLKHIKDSILQNTPRILETAYLPDSLYYKRLVSWKHDRFFNRVEPFVWDTTADYHFHDYPYLKEDIGGAFLGVPGSAVQTYNFFKREDPRSTVSFYAPYESWTYTPASIPMFNTKTPYTELAYYGNLLNSETSSNDDIRIFTTQNIIPALNVSLEFKTYGGAGILQNSKARNKTAFATANYLGKKYLAHGGIIWNSVNRAENGGLIDLAMVRDTTVKNVQELEVYLTSATNKYSKRTVFFDQTVRIPFSFIEDLKHRGDTSYVRKDTLNKDLTSVYLGTSSEWSVYNKMYKDAVNSSDAAGRAFYDNTFYINPSKSADSLHTMQLDNRVFLRFQPWHDDAVVSKLEGGVGDRYQSHYSLRPDSYLYKPKPDKWNSVYAYAGAEGRLSRYFEWDALGQLNFAGHDAGDFFIRGKAKISVFPFRRDSLSPISLTARFETDLKEPDYYEQYMYANHYMWDNDFSKVSTTRIQGSLDFPKWKIYASAGYALLANNLYYDSLGVIRQNKEAMSVLTAALRKDFHLGIFRMENSVLFQVSSDEKVVPVPKLAANLRWYLQFPIVREDVLKMQIGVDARYNTKWYAPGFNPVAGNFYNQREEEYGGTPLFDVFLNLQWKQACVFLKMENAGMGWPMEKHEYFSAHHYIYPPRRIKFGITWPFYPSLSSQKKMSDRAGSGMSGGGSGGRGGGRSGGLGGMLGAGR